MFRCVHINRYLSSRGKDDLALVAIRALCETQAWSVCNTSWGLPVRHSPRRTPESKITSTEGLCSKWVPCATKDSQSPKSQRPLFSTWLYLRFKYKLLLSKNIVNPSQSPGRLWPIAFFHSQDRSKLKEKKINLSWHFFFVIQEVFSSIRCVASVLSIHKWPKSYVEKQKVHTWNSLLAFSVWWAEMIKKNKAQNSSWPSIEFSWFGRNYNCLLYKKKYRTPKIINLFLILEIDCPGPFWLFTHSTFCLQPCLPFKLIMQSQKPELPPSLPPSIPFFHSFE